MTAPKNKVAVWHNRPYGYAVHVLGVDNDPVLTLGVGRTPVMAIEAAQDRVSDLVRGLQQMHDTEAKGKAVRV